jgi:hypothetical protein
MVALDQIILVLDVRPAMQGGCFAAALTMHSDEHI